MSENTTGRPVIVCTEHRGVFFGYADDTSGTTINLKRAAWRSSSVPGAA